MRLFSELFLVLLFFFSYQLDGQVWEFASFSYQFDGIYSATLLLMLATGIQALGVCLATRRIDARSLWLLAAVLFFGSMTLLIRNPLFIQWKPTIVNWGFALVYWIVARFSRRTVMERVMGNILAMPEEGWRQLNWCWVLYFASVGALNLLVAYSFSLDLWMYYKLYSFFVFIPFLLFFNWIVMKPYFNNGADSGKIPESIL